MSPFLCDCHYLAVLIKTRGYIIDGEHAYSMGHDKWQVIKNGVIVLDTYFNLLRLLFESGGRRGSYWRCHHTVVSSP